MTRPHRPAGRGKDSHHNEWLSLVEVSGPFLSMPVLHQHLPQGLGNPSHLDGPQLRAVYQEWQEGAADPALHRAWLQYVLQDLLEFPPEALREGQQLPQGLEARLEVHGETLRPDLAVVDPAPSIPGSGAVRLLFAAWPAAQDLGKPVPGLRWTASPQVRMMELLRSLGLRLGLVTNGEVWTLVHAAPNQTPAFVTWYAELWGEEPLTLRSFWELLSVGRTLGAEDERLEALIAESARDQQEVTDQLGRQVRQAVELLVSALEREDRARNRQLLAGVTEARLFDAALTVMMRLVFLMAAEERRLLPLDSPVYQQNYAVSNLGQQLREVADRQTEEVLERRHDAWCRLLATFRAVHGGVRHEDLQLPAYGGSLFDPDRFPFLEGRARGTRWKEDPASPLPLDNRVVLYCLEALQLLQVGTGQRQEARRVSFRALDVENIGHVYESLLDHAVRRAEGLVLGLEGSKDAEPEIPVQRLEEVRSQGEDGLVAYLKEQTRRGEPALRKSLTYEIKPDDHRLLVACDNDPARFQQVAPYAGLIRKDPLGDPVVIPPGGYYVTSGMDRRATGTHYTPRSLTEEIVTHTLDPLLYRGMAEGVDPSPQTLAAPEEILELKVADIAMGSGAFLVQACRYLAEKLLEAWARREAENEGRLLVRPSGALGRGTPGEEPLPTEPSERLLHARRLVAERCLYGVDKDSRAVEMAKLSLWLETMSVGKPFSFLDHALRCGDSLLGLRSEEQLEFFHPRPEGRSLTRFLFWPTLRDALERARTLRARLESRETVDEKDTAAKLALLHEATEATDVARLLGDVVIGAELACASGSETARDRLLEDLGLLAAVVADAGQPEEERRKAGQTLRRRADQLLNEGKPAGQAERRPFHWVVEFPEVFAGGAASGPGGAAEGRGFHAIVGNPPFIGGQRITGFLGTDYRDYAVQHLADGTRGSADLCAYFFLRAGSMLRPAGQFGLIATNTIAQGDSREVGLDRLAEDGYALPRAVKSEKWPGTANLEVSKVWARRGHWDGSHVLDGQRVRGIGPFLTVPGRVDGNPHRLAANAGKSFQGSIVLGMGFVLSPEEATELIRRDPRNREVLFPYLNGEDLNSRPDQSPSRWVINFFDWPLERAEAYPDCMAIVRERVKPERDRNNRAQRRERWWQFAERAPALYEAIAGMERVLAISRVSQHFHPAWVPTETVFAERLTIISAGGEECQAVIQSSFHWQWMLAYGSTHETRPLYTPSDCFETFPFPASLAGLEAIGEHYHEHRRLLILEHQEGLTKTYNRFHNPAEKRADILHLRDLHVQMDRAVADAYGWTDLALGHGFHDTPQGLRHTICPPARREVLDRLLELNHQRHAEEVAQGLHDKGKPKSKPKPGGGAPAAGKARRKPPTPPPPGDQLDLGF